MSDLSIFNSGGVQGEEELSIFASKEETMPTIGNDTSKKNVAAQGALLGDEGDLVGLYQELSADPETTSEKLEGITGKVHRESLKRTEDLVGGLLQAPGITSERAEQFVRTLAGDFSKRPSSADLLAEKMAGDDSGDESPEEEYFRIEQGATASKLNEQLRYKQGLLNSVELFGKGGLTQNMDDVLGMFTPFIDQAMLAQVIEDTGLQDTTSTLEAFTLLGNSVSDAAEHYKGLPWDQKKGFLDSLANSLNEARGINIFDDNDLMARELFKSITVDGYYGTFDQVFDNIISVAEASGLGMLVGRGLKTTKQFNDLGNITLDLTRADVQPGSVSSVVGNNNPVRARELQVAAELDVTGEAAQIITGSTPKEASVNSTMPQVGRQDGTVNDTVFQLDVDVKEVLETGRLHLGVEEIARAQDEIIKGDRFKSVNGVALHTTKSSVSQKKANGDIAYKGVYTPGGGRGWTSPDEAIVDMGYAFRDYDIAPENLTIMKKVKGELVPTDLKTEMGLMESRAALVAKKKKLPEELRKENMANEYFVQLEFNYELNPLDIMGQRDILEVKRNVFDRIGLTNSLKPKHSSLNRWINPIANSLDPRLVGAADVAVDAGSQLERVLMRKADKVLAPLKKLDSKQQELISTLLQEQNLAGKVYPDLTLNAMGVKPDQLQIFKDYRHLQDQLYLLENADFVKTLDSKGMKTFLDKTDGTELIVKEIGENSLGDIKSGSKIYDPVTKEVKGMSHDQLKQVYADGGQVARIETSAGVDAMKADYVKVPASDVNTFTRKFKSGDRALPYREAHATVRYKDPHFIIKTVTERGVIKREEAVMTASSVQSAKQAVKNLGRDGKEAGTSYSFRESRELNPDEQFQHKLQTLSNSGRTSQRSRGETLGQFKAEDVDSQGLNIQSPLESLKGSINSLSQRVPMREVLADMEARIIEQYGDLLPRNEFNQPFLPRDSSDIKSVGTATNKKAADLRSSVEYYNQLSHGYKNMVDDIWKVSINGIADGVGGVAPRLEKALRALTDEISSPTGWLRGRAFDLLIALSMPPSQWIVQGHAAIATAFLYPKYAMKGGLAKDFNKLIGAITMDGQPKAAAKLVGDKQWAEMQKLKAEWDRSGLGAGIDKHNMVEAGIDQFIDTGRFGRTKSLHRNTIGKVRQAGFDIGEFINLASPWLCERHKAIEAGESMSDPRTFDRVRQKTRALTQHMNRAGDMPWNKNSAGMLMQFLQSPYKGLTMWLDRGLTPSERFKLGTYHMLMVPLPAFLGYEIVSGLDIKDPVARELAYNGIMGGMYNTVTRAVLGDKTSVDFSRLTLQDPTIPYEMIHGLLTEGVGAMLAETPSAGLVMGRNPVLADLMEQTYKYITPWQDDEMDDPTEMALLRTFAETSSLGRSLSTGFREAFVNEYDNRYNKLGGVTREGVTPTETVFKAFFGMSTTFEHSARRTKNEIYQDGKEAGDDMRLIVRDISKRATMEGFNIDDPKREEYINRAVFMVNQGKGLSLVQQSALRDELNKQAKKGEVPIFNNIARATKHFGTDKIQKYISMVGEENVPELVKWVNSEEALQNLMGEDGEE